MDIGQIILETIRNPDIAYVLLILGLFSAIIAFTVPGTGFAEIAAGICLLLAVIGLSQLHVYWAGLLMILLGIGLFIVDLKLQSGAIAIGGAIALGIGSVFLFQTSPTQVGVSLWLIAIVTLGSLAFFVFGINRVMLAMRLRPKVSVNMIVGVKGVVKVALTAANNFTGTAQVGSELWTARSDQPLAVGTNIQVERVEGVSVWVSPAS